MSQDTSSNTATMASTERNTIPFVEADMENGCESGACGLAKAFYDSQCRLLWRLKTRGELSTFYRSTFDSWAPEEVKSNPGLHRQFAQVMFALVNDGQILRVNKGQYLVWTDPQNPANRRRNQGHRRGQQGPHRGHRGHRGQQGPHRDHQGPHHGHRGNNRDRHGPRRLYHESHVCTGNELFSEGQEPRRGSSSRNERYQRNPPAFGSFSESCATRRCSSPRNWASSEGEGEFSD